MKKVYRLQSRTAEKRQHFGIRRLKVGVASIAISASVFLAGNVLAQAEEANSVENTSIETVQPTSPTSEQSDKVEVTNHQAVVSESRKIKGKQPTRFRQHLVLPILRVQLQLREAHQKNLT